MAGSLKALKQEPVIFLPKLVSTFLGALWFVYLLDALKTAQVSPDILPLALGSTIALLFVGLFASVLVSAMVELRKSYSGTTLLRQSMARNGGKLLDTLKAVGFILSVMVVSYLVAGAGLLAYYIYGNVLFLSTGIVISLLIVFGMSYYLYFLPVSLFQKDSWRTAMRDSSKVSSGNRRDVALLMVFSLLILAPALYFTGRLETLGYAGFVASRMISGVVNTYVFVLSPEYYLSAEGLD